MNSEATMKSVASAGLEAPRNSCPPAIATMVSIAYNDRIAPRSSFGDFSFSQLSMTMYRPDSEQPVVKRSNSHRASEFDSSTSRITAVASAASTAKVRM